MEIPKWIDVDKGIEEANRRLNILLKALERIEEIKKKRLEEAKSLGIKFVAIAVAQHLGVGVSKKHGSYWIYPKEAVKFEGDRWEIEKNAERRDLFIVYDDYGNNLDIWSKGKKVFDVHLGEIKLYIPGEWVKELKKLGKVAEMVIREGEVRDYERKLWNECEKWGIDCDELIKSVQTKK